MGRPLDIVNGKAQMTTVCTRFKRRVVRRQETLLKDTARTGSVRSTSHDVLRVRSDSLSASDTTIARKHWHSVFIYYNKVYSYLTK